MSKLLPYLQLMRLPALFTAWADCFAGLVFTHSGLEPWSEFALLILATSGLYLAGMVFNDVFDRERDAQERPNRPIPSGKVSLRNAILLGIVLLAVGLGAAAAVGLSSLKIAAALTACLFAYNWLFKQTWLGPIFMGGCRFFNILLGASAIGAWNSIFTRPQLVVAAGIGVFIVGLTIFARSEAKQSHRGVLIAGILVSNAGIALLIWLVSSWPAAVPPERILIGLGVIALILNRRWFQAVFEPTPRNVQIGVKLGLWSLILFDAVLIFNKSGNPALALATAALLVPTFLLGKRIPMT